jgi:hypothetical protein
MVSPVFFQAAEASDLVEKETEEKSAKAKKLVEVPSENKERIYQLVSGSKIKIALNPSETDNPPWAWDPSKMESQITGWQAFIDTDGKTPLYLEGQSLGGGVMKGIFSYVISSVSYTAALDLVRQ